MPTISTYVFPVIAFHPCPYGKEHVSGEHHISYIVESGNAEYYIVGGADTRKAAEVHRGFGYGELVLYVIECREGHDEQGPYRRYEYAENQRQ